MGTIVVLSDLSRSLPGWEEARSIITGAGHEFVDLGSVPPGAIPYDALSRADAWLVGFNQITRELMASAPNLIAIARPGVGIDNVDVAAATDLGILVSNTPGSNADVVADHTFALMLVLIRDVFRLDGITRAGHGWNERPSPPQLAGRCLAIISTGNVGRAVATRARGFNMAIQAYDPEPDANWAAASGVRYLPFPEVLRGADVVSVHTPLLESTKAMIGANELALLAPGAILIAVSRGGVVDESALMDALRDGRLAGAGIDVFETEPCTSNPLFALPNVVVTPHVAGFSPEASRRARIMAARAIVGALAGRPAALVNDRVLSLPQCRLPSAQSPAVEAATP